MTGGVEPYAYAWFEGESEEAFADGMSVDSLLAGDYSVLAVDSTGCIGSIDFVIDAVDGLDESDVVWSVFPNPATDLLHVQVNTLGQGQLVLTDLNGRDILQRNVQTKRTVLDLSNVPAGAYMLRLTQGNTTTTQRIQVIR